MVYILTSCLYDGTVFKVCGLTQSVRVAAAWYAAGQFPDRTRKFTVLEATDVETLHVDGLKEAEFEL